MEQQNTKMFIYTSEQIDDIPAFNVGLINKVYDDSFDVQFVYANSNKIIDRTKCVVFNPLKTGDNFSHKICNVCHRYLPTEQFSRNQNGKNNRIIRRPSCDECRKVIDGIGISDADRKKWQKERPHFVIWECPICHKRTIPDLTSKVVLDHDHNTGKVRGWICDSCNTGIGRFKDEVELLKSAIDYLETN